MEKVNTDPTDMIEKCNKWKNPAKMQCAGKKNNTNLTDQQQTPNRNTKNTQPGRKKEELRVTRK